MSDINYFKNLDLPRVLTEEESNKLFEEYKMGGGISENIEDTLVRHNIRLVIKLASKFKNYDVDMEELISEGLIKLVQAVRTFNPSLNYKFSTYAGNIITKAMYEYVKKSFKKIPEVSLEEQLSEDFSIADTLSSDLDVENDFLSNEVVRDILGKLSEEEQALFKLYFVDGLTMKKIGEIMNMTNTLVSTKLTRLTEKIKIIYRDYHSTPNEIIYYKFNELKPSIKDYLILYLTTGSYKAIREKYNAKSDAVGVAIKRALQKLGCTKEELYNALIDANIIEEEQEISNKM